MYHNFAPTMPTVMPTSVTAHQGPSARWSREITRAWSASATAMPSATIAPQMPGKIPGTRAKGVGHVLRCSADSAGGAPLRQNRAAGPLRPTACECFFVRLDVINAWRRIYCWTLTCRRSTCHAHHLLLLLFARLAYVPPQILQSPDGVVSLPSCRSAVWRDRSTMDNDISQYYYCQ